MPLEEADSNQEYYGLMTTLSQQSLDAWNATALGKHIVFGYSFGRFAHEYPERPHTITWDLIDTLRPLPSELDPLGMAAARRRTADRLNAANSGPNENTIDPEALK